jgi:hypothetical protein
MDMPVNFAFLATHAVACGGGHISAHMGPTEGGRHQPCCGSDPWMMNVVNGPDHCRAECCRNEWPENACGNVSQKVHITYKSVDDLDGGRGPHGDNVWAVALSFCHGGEINS